MKKCLSIEEITWIASLTPATLAANDHRRDTGRREINGGPLREVTRSYAKLRLLKRNNKTMRLELTRIDAN